MKHVFPKLANPHIPGLDVLSLPPSAPFVPSLLYPPPKLYLLKRNQAYSLRYSKSILLKFYMFICRYMYVCINYLDDIELVTVDALFMVLLTAVELLLAILL